MYVLAISIHASIEEFDFSGKLSGDLMQSHFDLVIVGGGIVGLATAMKMARNRPGLKIAIVEKEDAPARHQTSHNSGVIHSGLYYRPGSMKAHMCVNGARELINFCREQDIPHDICGKVVVATHAEQIPRLHELYRRGTANGLAGLHLLDSEEAKAFEPYVNCLKALYVPATGIVDFAAVTRCYAESFTSMGGEILCNHRLMAIERTGKFLRLTTGAGDISSRFVINCAGLHSDRVAKMAGLDTPYRIVPFRGEYYRLKAARNHLVKGLIYPVPDPRFPFLGVHFTRMIDGRVEAGPNAVLAWAREGYDRKTICWQDIHETLRFRGFWHLVRRYWKTGTGELVRSYSKTLFVSALQKLVPELKAEDLETGGAGVRAQALGPGGELCDDFLILQDTERKMLHVLNAPSPAATSSLAIAEYLVEKALKFFLG